MKQCPKCFASVEEAGYACSAPHCDRLGIPAASSAADQDGKEGRLCTACNSRMTLRVCLQCGFELDADALERGWLPISLIGAPGSGKSNYLSVLVRELGSEFCRVYGCTLYPTGGDRTIDHFERDYHRPLFEQGICVPTTEQTDVDPLTYTLVFPKSSDAGKTCGVALYDSCGRNFASEADMSLYNRSVYHSKGIIFMLDPDHLPALRSLHEAKGFPVTRGDSGAILLRTIHLLRAGLGLDNINKKIPVPLAVCVGKMDTVFPYLEPASFLHGPSRCLRRPMLSSADISGCNLELQSLIESWGGREFLGHVSSQFSDFCFFGLSALGSQPDAGGEIPRVVPHRVLDPMLWLLWKNQIIRAG